MASREAKVDIVRLRNPLHTPIISSWTWHLFARSFLRTFQACLGTVEAQARRPPLSWHSFYHGAVESTEGLAASHLAGHSVRSWRRDNHLRTVRRSTRGRGQEAFR